MRFSALVSVLRSLGPVVVGISLGFTLSLLSVNWTEEACYLDGKEAEEVTVGQPRGARRPSSISTVNEAESAEDFEPKIVPYKQVQHSASKLVLR